MKKKVLTFLLAGMTVLQATGCASAIKGLTYNKEDFDYGDYDKIVIENAEFYVPEDMEGTGDQGTVVFEEKNCFIEAMNLTDGIYSEDLKALAKNIEACADDESIDVEINSSNTKNTTMDGIKKVIYTDAEINGDKGAVAYLTGDGYEVLLFVADDDFFEDNQKNVVIKSLTYSDDDDYTFAGDQKKDKDKDKDKDKEDKTEEPETETVTEEDTSEEVTEDITEEMTEEETEEDDAKKSSKKSGYTSNYVAPKALSSDMSDYICEFGGDLYKLPCPVSAFVDNGWVIEDDDADLVLNTDDYEVIGLTRGDDYIAVASHNYSGDIIDVENGLVNDLSDASGEFGLIVGKNIKNGAKAQSVVTALDQSGFEAESDSETVYAYDSNMNGYYFSVKDGKINYISIENDVY